MVKKLNLWISSVILAGVCISCTYDFVGMIAAGSSVDERFRDSMEESGQNFYPKNVSITENGYRFLVATDLHIKDNQWDRVRNFFTMGGDGRYLMTMLLGDYPYTAGASLLPLADIITIIEGLRVFPAIGNHDVYKDGYQATYRPIFGPTCYYFRVSSNNACDLFLILDSANGTLGNDQFRWLQNILSQERGSCRHCFIFTHSNFFSPAGYFDTVSTYPIEEQMKLLDVFAKNNVTVVFTGHSHAHDETKVRGVKYITLNPWSDTKKGNEYCQVECSPDGNVIFTYQEVPS